MMMGATEALSREIQACRIIFWLRENYRLGRSGSMAKEQLYADYVRALEPDPSKPSVVPTYFGKLVKKAFPAVRCNRKGPRGKAKQHYTHLQRVDHEREAQRNRFLSTSQQERPSDGQTKDFQRYISSELSYLNYLLKSQEQTEHEHVEERSPSSQATSSPKYAGSTSPHPPTPQDEGELESKDWDWVFVFDAERKSKAKTENGRDLERPVESVSPRAPTKEQPVAHPPKPHSSADLSDLNNDTSTPPSSLPSYARTIPRRLDQEMVPSWPQRDHSGVDYHRPNNLLRMQRSNSDSIAYDKGDSCSSPDASFAYPSSSWRSFDANLSAQRHVPTAISQGIATHYPAAISQTLLQRERPITYASSGPVSWRESRLPELHSAPMSCSPQVLDRLNHPAPRFLPPIDSDSYNNHAMYSETPDSRVHHDPAPIPHFSPYQQHWSAGGLELRYPYSGSAFIPSGSKHVHNQFL